MGDARVSRRLFLLACLGAVGLRRKRRVPEYYEPWLPDRVQIGWKEVYD